METEAARREFMALALEQRPQVWGFLMGLTKDPQRAEELCQSTYLIVVEKWKDFTPGTNFLAWARQIARYEFLASVDPERKPFVTAESEVLEAAMHSAEGHGATPSARGEALRQCLKDMPEAKGRQALNLRYAEGLAGEQGARRLGMTTNAFYTLLSRVRKFLQECVERRLRIDEE